MSWDELPEEIIKYILFFRNYKTLSVNCALKIQSIWKCYKTKILIQRYKLLRYLKDFRIWNPNIQVFLLRSRL